MQVQLVIGGRRDFIKTQNNLDLAKAMGYIHSENVAQRTIEWMFTPRRWEFH